MSPPVSNRRDTDVDAWLGVIAGRRALLAPENGDTADDPVVLGVAHYCADRGVPVSDRMIDLLLARALRATGRAQEALRAVSASAVRPIRTDARPGYPGWLVRLDDLADQAHGGEIAVYPSLRAAVEAAVRDAGKPAGPLALSGAEQLARRLEGRRASRRRIRARCEDFRRFCSTVAARAAEVSENAPPEVIHFSPLR